MGKIHKKKSKRMTCRLRYKIEKKVRDHKRKLRKESKKNGPKRKPKDPGIPNSLPFKDKILAELEERKIQNEELKQRQKEERAKLLMANQDIGELAKDAEKRTEKFIKKAEGLKEFVSQGNRLGSEQSTKAFHKKFHEVIEAADVVIEVLDARDPLGTRCPQVEKAVIESGGQKHLVLLLNKVDLIPRGNMEEWIKYLRNEFPTIAFKASTQVQKSNISRKRVAIMHSSESLMQSSHCIGAHTLMKVLGNYCRGRDIQVAINVGIVGFPNVGKSSVINSLKRSKACPVGATPGVTKNIQEIVLDKHIKLLDSPGIVLSKETVSHMALHNALKVENLPDPIQPMQSIFGRLNKEQLMLFYRLPEFDSCNDFLCLLAKRIGKLKKGGTPDIEMAARKVLQDWNSGKIKYYCQPPKSHELPAHVSAEIVLELSKPFDIDSLLQDEEKDMECLPYVLPSDALMFESAGLTEAKLDQEKGDSDPQAMSEDETATEISSAAVIKLDNKNDKGKENNEDAETKKLLSKMQLNKAKKIQFKKMKKNRKRKEKLENMLSTALDSAL